MVITLNIILHSFILKIALERSNHHFKVYLHSSNVGYCNKPTLVHVESKSTRFIKDPKCETEIMVKAQAMLRHWSIIHKARQ